MRKIFVSTTLMTGVFLAGFAYAAANGPHIGQIAPEFELNDLSNKPITLSSLRKKGHVLLIFWSTRCHVCHIMLPVFKKTYEKYRQSKITIAAINVGFEGLDEVKRYTAKHAIDYLVLNDDNKKGHIASTYGLTATPTVKLIAPNGKIVWTGHHIPALKKWIK